MLIRFITTNCKSYQKETLLELVASNKYQDHPDHVVDLGPVKLLKHAVIFGSDRASKSAFIEAFSLFQACLLQGVSHQEPSLSFEVQCSVSDTYYDYGFTLQQGQIREEWLTSLTDKQKVIFRREHTEKLLLSESSVSSELTALYRYLTENIIVVDEHTPEAVIKEQKEDTLFVIDGQCRERYPLTTRRSIEAFMKSNQKGKQQLICTCHDAHLMDQALFRLDEIWLVDRDRDNSSYIYSLDRFKERKGCPIRKSYLEGRFGGR